MYKCRICNSKIESFMTFGQMPIANGFRLVEDSSKEYFFELAPAYCSHCHMFQILDQPEKEKMFHGNYAFYSSTSQLMIKHFKDHSEKIIKNYLHEKVDPFVVELGSNDGIQLKNFQESGIRHLGIEPSQNVAENAQKQGIETISEFFNDNLAKEITRTYGHADCIIAANVMCHIDDLHSVIRGVDVLLKEDGLMIFEDPYLGAMIEKTSYDQIYDEHVFIFSAHSVQSAFSMHSMELVDVEELVTHGGSMRYTLAKKGQRRPSKRVKQLLDQEKDNGLNDLNTYLNFKEKCEKSKKDFVDLLKSIKAEGKRVVGYGATSKSTTVLNYCNIGSDIIEYISDTTEIKQGKVTPGKGIPVVSYDKFKNDKPDYTVLFAWNHAKEIMSKETEYSENIGKWIVYIPKVEVL